MKFTTAHERFIEHFVKEIEGGNAAIFAGAGLSVPTGCVNWRELLREIAKELGLDIDRESDLVSVAQYHVNRHGGNRGHLNRAILEQLTPKTPPTQNHRLLAHLPIRTWWTTNYDKLLEIALQDEGRIPDVKFQISQLAHTKPRRDATIYKMHGDIDHPAQAVLTRDDYERYERNHGPFLNALVGDLVSKTFLFVGFGFSDPNLSSVLSHIRVRFEENQRPHYAIFKNVSRNDCKSEEEFEYEKTKQILHIEDLRRFNINAVLVDAYSEIDAILTEIHRRYTSSSLFISTSAYNFSPWDEKRVHEFMFKLGKLVTERGFRVVTGLGAGTGNAIMSGAALAIVSKVGKRLDEDLIVRPFPQFTEDPTKREALWTEWRQDMIGRSGVALFLFGNKLLPTGVGPATGMIQEYEIAKKFGVTLLPIGGTGSASKMLADQSLSNENGELNGLDESAQNLLRTLSKHVDELDNLLGPILDLLEEVRNQRVVEKRL